MGGHSNWPALSASIIYQTTSFHFTFKSPGRLPGRKRENDTKNDLTKDRPNERTRNKTRNKSGRRILRASEAGGHHGRFLQRQHALWRPRLPVRGHGSRRTAGACIRCFGGRVSAIFLLVSAVSVRPACEELLPNSCRLTDPPSTRPRLQAQNSTCANSACKFSRCKTVFVSTSAIGCASRTAACRPIGNREAFLGLPQEVSLLRAFARMGCCDLFWCWR